MDDAEYRNALRRVFDAVDAGPEGWTPSGSGQGFLRGTSAIRTPTTLSAGTLCAIGDGRTPDVAIARVLPGGQLLQVLALRDGEGRWLPGRTTGLGRKPIFALEGVSADDARAFEAACVAMSANARQVASIRKRATGDNKVFGPCLAQYDAWVQEHPGLPRTTELTEVLLGAFAETSKIIGKRATAKHGDEESRAMSVINSRRRSAGTNYQALVALAIAEDLLESWSCWYIEYPPPREYIQSLALRFTAKSGSEVEIDPDIDILIRNAAWDPASSGDEPVVMLSVKTSLADRAGAAARWKMYFDVATHTCPFADQLEGCAWHAQGLRFAKPDLKVRLEHCIVTANIYKVTSDERFAAAGELGTAQTKANTFMFDRRYATRTGALVAMDDWEPLTELRGLLDHLSDATDVPY